MSGHLHLIERELRDLLAKENADTVVKWVKERVLESYRNGHEAGGKSGPAPTAEGGLKPIRRYPRRPYQT